MTNSQDTMDLFADDVTNTTPLGQGTEAFVEEDVPADAQPSGTTLTDVEPPNVPPITSASPDEPERRPPLAEYAARAYLAYAMSVVTGRAIPSLADGKNQCNAAFSTPCAIWACNARQNM